MTNGKKTLHGIITAMVTPLRDQKTLDHAGLERLTEHLIAGGVHGLFPLGTTGEASALAMHLREEVIERVCAQAVGRLPVVVCVTDTSLAAATRLARKAKECGATAIATAPPFYYALTQEEILRYVERLARETEMPLLLYNAPGNTHHTIHPATVKRAAQIEGVVGIKDSGLSMSYFHEVHAALAGREDFSLLVGPEELLAECVLFGGHGGMAAGSNVYPRLYVELYEAAATGDVARVAPLHQEALAFAKAIYHGHNPLRGIKCALGLMGMCSPVLTEPLASYTPEQRAAVEKYLGAHRAEIQGTATPWSAPSI